MNKTLTTDQTKDLVDEFIETKRGNKGFGSTGVD